MNDVEQIYNNNDREKSSEREIEIHKQAKTRNVVYRNLFAVGFIWTFVRPLAILR